jgi:predicted flap endonuclease-1-like 5' DNA nuclease
VHKKLDGEKEPHDDLCVMKGVGPKLAEALRDLGFARYEQLAHLTPAEIDRLDERLGSFRGRIARDRIVEQADYLARGDADGFEQKFGKL